MPTKAIRPLHIKPTAKNKAIIPPIITATQNAPVKTDKQNSFITSGFLARSLDNQPTS